MKRAEMRELAVQARDEVAAGDVTNPVARIRPVVASRTPFPLLDLAGRVIAEAAQTNLLSFTAFLDALARTSEIGVWPLVGSALAVAYLPHDLSGAFAEARRYIFQADVWHATDAIAERVLGEGLRTDFAAAGLLLERWRKEENPWLRRAVGVAVHLYVKRERNRPDRATRLLGLLAPLFEEHDVAALKGIGWGLKTIGKFYPDLLVPWLRSQVAATKPRKLMVRKAVTYLPDDVKDEFL